MQVIKKVFLLAMLVTVAAAQSLEPPLSDSRFTVHTLLREDIFAGFLADDMERFSRGEKNIELLLEKRPSQRGNLLAWKGGATLYRAVLAYENKNTGEFQRYYQQALDFFSEAGKSTSGNEALPAIMGGSLAIFADRLPKEYRAKAWSQSYDSYQMMWKQQGSMVEKLPLHLRGELLSGLVQTSQRTGRTDEMTQYLDKIFAVLPGTPYESVAKKWKENPKVAASTSMTCLTCHDQGRLAARITALNK